MLQPALDEAYAIPTEHNARLALRTQQILAYETGITKVADPLGDPISWKPLLRRSKGRSKGKWKRSNPGGAVKAIEMDTPRWPLPKRPIGWPGKKKWEKELSSGE